MGMFWGGPDGTVWGFITVGAVWGVPDGAVWGRTECRNGIIRGVNFCIVFHGNYGSILFSFQDMTPEQTTNDGRRSERKDGRTDRRLQATHMWLYGPAIISGPC